MTILNFILQVLLLILIIAANIYYLICIVAAKQFFSKPVTEKSSDFPPVTILIPLSGADFEGYENYISFCTQDYPQYQIIFGVRDESDTSVPVVQRLISDFPKADITLSVSSETIGVNLKVSNLQSMMSIAKYDRIVVVDSDIRVGANYLRAIFSELEQPNVGLVTCLYRARNAVNLAAMLEAVGITSEFAAGVLVARKLEGIKFALGATLATSREALQSIGGFPALADYLADDFMLGNLIAEAKYEVCLSSYVVETVLPVMTFRAMMKHQIRWARSTRASRPKGYIGLLFTYGVVPAGLYTVVAHSSLWNLVPLGITLALRFATSSYIGIYKLKDQVLRKHFWLIPLREILSFIVWCISLTGKTVEWRGKLLELNADGKIRPLSMRLHSGG